MADKFKVFLSWSGERSKLAARALRDWLPYVLQSVEPWMSEQDIQAGQQWFDEIGRKLKDSGYGVFCITNENLNKPWILFEAGAIWKAFDGTLLSSYTFGLAPADIPGNHPLSQFQGIKAEEEGTKKLVDSINNATGIDKLDTSKVNKLFDKWWPELESALKSIPDVKPEKGDAKTRKERELLEDVLNSVRTIEQNMLKEDSPAESVQSRHSSTTSYTLATVSPKHTDSILRIFNNYPGFKLALRDLVQLLKGPIDSVSYLNEVMHSLNYLVFNNEILLTQDANGVIYYLKDSLAALDAKLDSRKSLKAKLDEELKERKNG